MTLRSRQIAKLLIRVAVTTGLLVWVFSQIDLGQFRQALQAARWQFLIATWALAVLLLWIRSVKMKYVLKKQDCNVAIGTLFGATAVTALYSMIMPGMLSTGVKWYILKRITGKGSNVFSSMLYNQLVTMIVMTLFGLAALMIANPTPLLLPDSHNTWLLPAVCGVLLTLTILVSALLLSRRSGGRMIKVMDRPLRLFGPRIHEKGREVLDQIAGFQTAGAGFHTAFVAATAVDTLIGGVATYVLAARAANITAPLGVFVWLCAAIYILGRLPISVANLGVRESLLVWLLSVYGVEKSAAMLMSMILFSSLVAMAVLGAMYQLSWALSARKKASQPS